MIPDQLPALNFDLGERVDMLRDAKLHKIGGGNSEVRRMLIGRALFKETV